MDLNGIMNIKKEPEEEQTESATSRKADLTHADLGFKIKEEPCNDFSYDNREGEDFDSDSEAIFPQSMVTIDLREEVDCGVAIKSEYHPPSPSRSNSAEDKGPFKCCFCKEIYSLREDLVQHIQEIHFTQNLIKKNKFICSICGKGYSKKSLLDKHNRSHSVVKPFSCKICGKSFLHEFSMTSHRRVHIDDSNVYCFECHKPFKSNRELKKHSKLHTTKKTYPCEICNKKFNCLADVNRHLLVHKDGKWCQKKSQVLSAEEMQVYVNITRPE